MIDVRLSTKWGLLGCILGLMAFSFNYHWVELSLPGYEVIAAPAMLVLSFFSEEMYFTPKMILFLFGQFFGYFIVASAAQWGRKFIMEKNITSVR